MELRDEPGTSNEAAEPAGRGAVPEHSTAEVRGAIDCPPRNLGADDWRDLLLVGADWLWETDGELRFSWFSESYQEVTGIDPKTALGRFRFDFLKKVSKGSRSVEAHLSDLAARRPFRDFVYELSDGNPNCRWISISGYPRFDAGGTFLGYRGIGRNVSTVAASVEEIEDLKGSLARSEERASKLIGDSEGAESNAERLMAALNVMSDAFCYYDKDDKLVLYNEAMLTTYRGLEDIIRPGLDLATFVDTALARDLWVIGDVAPALWREGFMQRHRERDNWQSVLNFTDGRWTMRRSMHTDDGGTIAISTDITELKVREARIEKAKEEAETAQRRLQVASARGEELLRDLQRALDAMTLGVVLVDADMKAEFINRAFYSIWRLGPTDVVVGDHFRALMDVNRSNGIYDVPDDRWEDYVQSRIGEIVDGDVAAREFRRRDGQTLIYSVTALSGGKRLVCYYDISEMKKREAELARLNEQSQTMLSDVRRMLDAMKMGVVLVDADLNTEIINKAFYDMWRLTSQDVAVGEPFRSIITVRHSGIHDVPEPEWAGYVESRLAEVKTGDLAPREFHLADGRTMIYSITALSGGKRLVSYYDVSALKEREIETARALEQAKLSVSVLDGVTNPMFVKDSDLTFVLVNKAFAALFDREPEEMIGRKGGDFVPQDDAEGFERSERHVLETGEIYEVEENFEFSGIGRSRIVKKSRIATESGKDYVACSIFDITDLRRRETEIEQAHRLLTNVLDSLPAGIIIYDRDDRFVLANKRLKESLPGLDPAWVPGKTFREALNYGHSIGFFRNSGDAIVDALYVKDKNAWLDAYMHRHSEPKLVYERQHKDGTWHQVHDTHTSDGTFVGVRVDISDLKRREAQLKESLRENEVFRSIIDHVPVSIYAKRPDLKLLYVNQGWCNLLGLSREEAIGKSDTDLFGEAARPFLEGDLAVLRTGERQEIEEQVIRADGSVQHQLAQKSVVTASDGSLYLIGSTTDITELKQRERELMEAQRRAVLADRAKSEFLANMSHEIRTPMNGVLGMAELLAKSDLNPKQKTFTDIIVKSGNALLTIINDILDFSKIDAGQLVLDPAPFNLAEAIEDVATLVSTRAKEKDLELIVRVEPECQQIFVGDVGRIRQIITNLLGNAVKFTEAGHVLVDVSAEGTDGKNTKIRMSVTDTGIGIPEDKIKLVFEKFSQVDGSSTRRHEGTGLGLAITSRLVELMGGEIGVESEEGKGSTFWFTVMMPNAGRVHMHKVAPIDVTGSRILIVDDNAVNRAILSEQMASWTFDSCAAENGPEGIQVLKAAAQYGLAVDCVVLDYQMPGMTGADAARIIRSTPEIADTPIVILTSVDQSLNSVAYRDLAIDAQLIKPARSSQLLETIVGTIQKYRQTKAGGGVAEEASPAVTVPAAQSQGKAVPAPPAPVATVSRPTAQPKDARLDILVAEDNEVNQLVFTQILAETNYSYEIVKNGRLAVEAFRVKSPRMILMDVSMPEMNGLEATDAIRKHEEAVGTRVPIVGVTAHALKGDRERCIEAGMDDYLPKPISPKALLDKVERWVHDGGTRRQTA